MQDSSGYFILCDELLIKILKYVGKYRDSAKLVCKKFLAIVCDIERNDLLYLDCEKLANDEAFVTIMNLKRKIGKIWIDSREIHSLKFYNRLKQICIRHGANVKKLYWNSENAYSQAAYIEILSLMPNLEKLSCDTWEFSENYTDEPIDFKLKNLKHLKMIFCEAPIIQLMNKLLEENSINELCIYSDLSIFDAKDLLLRQGKLEKIDVELKELIAEEFQCEGLKDLTCYLGDSFNDSEKLFIKYPNLTKIDVENIHAAFDDPDAFINMCQLKLTKLQITIDEIDATIFKNHFWRLTDLTKLVVSFDEHKEIFEIFLNMKFPQMKSLILHPHYEISRADLRKMAKNLPALEKIGIYNCTVRINYVLKYLTNVTSIGFCSEDVILEENQLYSRIKNVFISDSSETQIKTNEALLLKIMQSFPDLCSIKCDLFLPLNIKLLNDILTRLPHLHTLHYLIFVQEGDDYEEFTEKSALELKRFIKEIPNVCVSVRLKDTEMNEAKLKETLGHDFDIQNFKDDCNFVISTQRCKYCNEFYNF